MMANLPWACCCLLLLMATVVTHAECIVGMIQPFAFNFCPTGYLECNGQDLEIAQNQFLFSVIGIKYGGTGANFRLPDIRGRIVVGGSADTPQSGGETKHTLISTEMPVHNHRFVATSNSADLLAAGTTGFVAQQPFFEQFSPQAPNVPFGVGIISSTGTGLGHENQQPFQVIGRFCICAQGVLPSS